MLARIGGRQRKLVPNSILLPESCCDRGGERPHCAVSCPLPVHLAGVGHVDVGEADGRSECPRSRCR